MSRNIDETKIPEWVKQFQEKGYIINYHNIENKKVLCLIRKNNFLLGRFYKSYVYIYGYDLSDGGFSQIKCKLDLRDDLKELGIPYKDSGIRNVKRILRDNIKTMDTLLARL